MQSVSGAISIYCLSLSSPCLAAASAPAAVIVILQ